MASISSKLLSVAFLLYPALYIANQKIQATDLEMGKSYRSGVNAWHRL